MAELTSRERVLTALGHGIPDRVPYMELLVDQAFGLRLLGRSPAAEPPVMSGSLPVTCAFFGGQAYDPIDLARGLDLDGFCMSIQPRIYFRTTVSEGMHYVVGGQIKTRISGPANTLRKDAADMQLPLTVTLSPDGETATLDVDGQVIHLKKGELSRWMRLTFRPGLGTKLRCVCRFLVSSITPNFEMYVTPLNIDPARPALPISHPFYYSVYLAKLLGSYVTLGLANDTWALNEGALPEDGFLELAYAHHDEWEKIFFNALGKTARGTVVCVFETTDSIQHMFFRYLDEGHPALKSGDGRRRPEIIEELYRRMDEMIGRVRQKLGDRSVLMVMSDHGFKSFRRGVNLNTWLAQNGYMTLLNGSSHTGEWFRGVDWGNTKAYALGLGGIYVNLKGREAQGTVAPGPEEATLKREIADKLSALVDGECGHRAINKVLDRDAIYRGPYKENSPDLIVGYSEGYRASWESVKGVAGPAVFTDNCKPWSGDHCIDADIVPGVLFCSEKLECPDPHICDIAPTALDLFGVPVPAHMDGRSLVTRRSVSASVGDALQ